MPARKRKPASRKEKSHAIGRGKAAHAKPKTQLPAIPDAPPNKGGHPTDFKPAYVEQARKLAAWGHIDREIAEFFGCDERTFRRWKIANPEFAAALKVGKSVPDDRVERCLYNRAVGYTFESEELFVDRHGDEHRMPTLKHVAPDTTAQIFWLKNRRPDEWRDRQQIDLNLTTAEGLAAARKRALDSRVVSEQTPAEAA